MTQAILHDGTVLDFPDETKPEVIQKAVKNYLGQKNQPMSMGDVAGQAVKNIPSSAMEYGKNIVQAVSHPLETAETAIRAGAGGLQNILPDPVVDAVNKFNNLLADKTGIVARTPERGQPNPDIEVANAIGKMMVDRYGGVENIKQTLAKDPVGFAADLSTILTGGGSLVSKAPGMVGKTGQAVKAAGQAIDPLGAAVKGVGAVGSKVVEPVLSNVLGTTTGAGAESIRQAAKAGAEGGERAEGFLKNLRGQEPMLSVIDDAKAALEKMHADKSATYRAGAAKFKADKTVLDFKPIEQAFDDLRKSVTVRGEFPTKSPETGTFQRPEHLSVGKQASGKLDEIAAVIDEWKADPSVHTVEGFDALKKRIDDLRPPAMERGQADRIVTTMRNAIKGEIVKQAPSYARVMKDYERASNMLGEIERALSLGNKASADTSLRKLQSVLRNNVSTNYGNRAGLVKELEQAGADITPKLAGQALSSATPRGLQALGATGVGAGAAMTNPMLLPGLAAASPRLVGEAAYYGGKAGGAVGRGADIGSAILDKIGASPQGLGLTAFQAGRANTNKDAVEALKSMLDKEMTPRQRAELMKNPNVASLIGLLTRQETSKLMARR